MYNKLHSTAVQVRDGIDQARPEREQTVKWGIAILQADLSQIERDLLVVAAFSAGQPAINPEIDAGLASTAERATRLATLIQNMRGMLVFQADLVMSDEQKAAAADAVVALVESVKPMLFESFQMKAAMKAAANESDDYVWTVGGQQLSLAALENDE